MGTTADKGAYLNDTKSLLKQKINNLGGDITDQTTFRQYAEQLQNVYDILPKTSYAEGSNITLSNTLKGKLDFEDGIVGIGDTSQKSYEGYNLAPITDNRYNLDDDNIISISRHDDNNGIIYTQFDIRSGETIYLYFIKYNNINNNTSFMGNNDNTNLSFTNIQGLTNNTLYKKTYTATSDITIKITMWGNANNETLKFQLWATKDEAKDTFEPFVGNSPSPSPSYPQDIEVVRGKNRFDGELLPNSYNPTTGEIEASSTSYRSNKIPLQKNETYYLSGITGNVRVLYWNNTSYVSSEVITMPNSFITKGNIIAFQFDKSLSHENIMLEKGSQATSYLPYNTLEVVERGKNEAYVNSSTSPNVSDFAKIEQGKTYTFSMKVNGSMSGVNLRYGENTIKTFYGASGNISHTFVAPITGTLNLNGYGVDNFNGYENIQLEEGSTATTYEPYQTPQTYQLSLGEYEFAKIGNYVDYLWTDRSTKKWYYHSITDEVILKGTETYTYDSTYTRFYTQLSFSYDTSVRAQFLCNRYINGDSTTSGHFGTNAGGKLLYFYTPNSSITTTDGFKTWLSNNNLKILLKKAEGTDTEITDTTLINQLEDIYNMHSFTGTTIIEINGNLPLIIKVRALKGN